MSHSPGRRWGPGAQAQRESSNTRIPLYDSLERSCCGGGRLLGGVEGCAGEVVWAEEDEGRRKETQGSQESGRGRSDSRLIQRRLLRRPTNSALIAHQRSPLMGILHPFLDAITVYLTGDN